jgi:hypothetical protein
MFAGMKHLLVNHGAKSLHLFPINELPGYNPEDMQAIITGDKTSSIGLRLKNGSQSQ